ncbi:MAG: MYXO-CTERM sorting domain-containing protein [Myxococcota bacterium]
MSREAWDAMRGGGSGSGGRAADGCSAAAPVALPWLVLLAPFLLRRRR